MKTTAILLAASLLAPVLLILGASAVAAATLFTIAGLAAITLSDYGHSAKPSYATASARVTIAAKHHPERHPLAA